MICGPIRLDREMHSHAGAYRLAGASYPLIDAPCRLIAGHGICAARGLSEWASHTRPSATDIA
jgi:hypothetical protein